LPVRDTENDAYAQPNLAADVILFLIHVSCVEELEISVSHLPANLREGPKSFSPPRESACTLLSDAVAMKASMRVIDGWLLRIRRLVEDDMVFKRAWSHRT
jgi:hypothetical protein